jgi:hypothetical protein
MDESLRFEGVAGDLKPTLIAGGRLVESTDEADDGESVGSNDHGDESTAPPSQPFDGDDLKQPRHANNWYQQSSAFARAHSEPDYSAYQTYADNDHHHDDAVYEEYTSGNANGDLFYG